MTNAPDTSFLICGEERNFEEPGPPTSAELDLEYAVFNVCKHFDEAARGQDVLWALEISLGCVRNLARVRTGLRPDAEDLDRLLRSAARAQVGAMTYLQQGYSRTQIALAMEAAMGLLIHWSESDEERELRHPDEIADMREYVGMLRRDLQNMSALDDIRKRAFVRRSRTIAELHASAHEQGAA